MRRNSLAGRKRAIALGIVSGLLLASLTTAQVALAGPAAGPSAQSTIPTPLPTPPPPPPLPTAVADETTVSYNWSQPTTTNVPLSSDETAPKAQVNIPARSMSAGGLPASGNVTIVPVPAESVPAIDAETTPDAPTITFLNRTIQINVEGSTAEGGAPSDITSQVRFNPPLVLSFEITEQEWLDAGQDPARFQIRFYSVALGQWIEIPTTVDPFTSPIRVQGTVSHLTTFGLFRLPPAPAPDGGDFSVGAGLLALIALVGTALIGSGAYMLRKGGQTAA